MNRTQLEYDLIVQARNKEAAFDNLKLKEKKLKTRTETLRKEGQIDKARNHRQHTLYEYRDAIAEFERRQKMNARKLKYLKRKLNPPKPHNRV